jgi:hypothetical protein
VSAPFVRLTATVPPEVDEHTGVITPGYVVEHFIDPSAVTAIIGVPFQLTSVWLGDQKVMTDAPPSVVKERIELARRAAMAHELAEAPRSPAPRPEEDPLAERAVAATARATRRSRYPNAPPGWDDDEGPPPDLVDEL